MRILREASFEFRDALGQAGDGLFLRAQSRQELLDQGDDRLGSAVVDSVDVIAGHTALTLSKNQNSKEPQLLYCWAE